VRWRAVCVLVMGLMTPGFVPEWECRLEGDRIAGKQGEAGELAGALYGWSGS